MLLSYGYDKSGNITSIQDSLQGNLSYRYDALNRLNEFKKDSIIQEAFDYDVLGNRTMHRWLLPVSRDPGLLPVISLSKVDLSTNNATDKALLGSKSTTRYMSFAHSFRRSAAPPAIAAIS